MLDFLSFFLKAGRLYAPVMPLLLQKLRENKPKEILDLASGGAGPLQSLLPQLIEAAPEVHISLSDLFPNPASWQLLEAEFPRNVGGISKPIDALQLPPDNGALLTMFSALHHFSSPVLRELLRHVAQRGQPALFCDGGGVKGILIGGVAVMPLLFWAVTPWLRPFSVQRLLLTYLLPVIPFCTVWDGAVSVLRLYSLRELKQFAAECSTDTYRWQAGRFRKFPGVYVYFLAGQATES